MKYKEDGVDHINIYSKGQTELGRLLSNFAHTAFLADEADGTFQSVEAYWYFLLVRDNASDEEVAKLRNLSGFSAKRFGKELVSKYGDGGWNDYLECGEDYFRKKIESAFCDKLRDNPELRELLRESTLPLTHYYVFEGNISEPTRHSWQVKYWEAVRRLMNHDFSLNAPFLG